MKIMRKNGFTLIELLATCVIVGLLVAMSVGGMKSQGIKNKRTEAKNTLYEIMQREEKYMSENNTYTISLKDLGYGDNTVTTNNGNYKITAKANAVGISDGVILTAIPQGNQEKDTDCNAFILNSNGVQSTNTSSTKCW